MDGFDSIWQVFLISLVAGALIGALAYRLFDPSSKKLEQLKTERDSANQELETYKAGVSEHFDKTSEMFNDLTQNYVKVYQHLAEGAKTLGEGKAFNNLLEQNQSKVALAAEAQSIVNEVTGEIDPESSSDTEPQQPDEIAAVYATGRAVPAIDDEDLVNPEVDADKEKRKADSSITG